ncbi:hypothetical protein RvY_06536 [Ramazzottius varieornatus]|uniref:Uncharacterized protein n=1 Tax=Ramazzottius varieornatus TaxID=947166 RepID=A0A1D1V2C9_RAMVA|nr:hypothetical protein RvY_06536 [Ramazzottius varieornatus]
MAAEVSLISQRGDVVRQHASSSRFNTVATKALGFVTISRVLFTGVNFFTRAPKNGEQSN